MSDKLSWDDSNMIVNWDPKKAEGLIQIPEDATLKEVIELINDINLNISNDEELAKKWSKWMPNTKGVESS